MQRSAERCMGFCLEGACVRTLLLALLRCQLCSGIAQMAHAQRLWRGP